jgi:hypothetical protein
MAIGSWRQMPPRQRHGKKAPKKPPPPPPGHPLLTGYTEAQAAAFKKDTEALSSIVDGLPNIDADIPANGGTGPSARDKSSVIRMARKHMGLK